MSIDKKLEEAAREYAKKYKNSLSRGIENDIYDDFIEGAQWQAEQDKEKEYVELSNSFWKRLEMFISGVNVNDPMSEEEKEMILNVCKKYKSHNPEKL